MNFVTDTLRYAQLLCSVPMRAVHWASFKITYGVTEWHPLKLYDRDRKYAVLILNQPLTVKREKMITLWNRATLRATVDGGTNEWYKFSENTDNELYNPIPDIVTGDFDSVEPEVLEHYRSNGAIVIYTPDQDETDYHKCIRQIAKEVASREVKIECAISIVENSGRLDHIMSNVNTLFHGPSILGVPLYQFTSNSITWILKPGRHKINIDERMAHQWCGLIPVGEPACITTSGFKWNLASGRLEFGGMISSSNMFTEECVVTVETDRPILFTMALP